MSMVRDPSVLVLVSMFCGFTGADRFYAGAWGTGSAKLACFLAFASLYIALTQTILSTDGFVAMISAYYIIVALMLLWWLVDALAVFSGVIGVNRDLFGVVQRDWEAARPGGPSQVSGALAYGGLILMPFLFVVWSTGFLTYE